MCVSNDAWKDTRYVNVIVLGWSNRKKCPSDFSCAANVENLILGSPFIFLVSAQPLGEFFRTWGWGIGIDLPQTSPFAGDLLLFSRCSSSSLV